MKTENRQVRWQKLVAKLRFKIRHTYSSKRLQTLVRRLQVVNRDKRKVLQ